MTIKPSIRADNLPFSQEFLGIQEVFESTRVFVFWLKVKGSNEAVTVVIVRSGKQVGNISLTYPVACIMKKRSLLSFELQKKNRAVLKTDLYTFDTQ